MPMPLHLSAATSEDLPWIVQQLNSAHLPTADLADKLESLFIAYLKSGHLKESGRIGVGGLERLGSVGLLRSLVIVPSHRGQGFGKQVTQALLDLAQDMGLQDVYLLTTNQSSFFGSLGFVTVDRDQVPDPIRHTSQFSDLCPASAQCMQLHLPRSPVRNSMKRIMFVCKKNSRRSQMAEGFARHLGQGKVSVTSAGLESSQVDPLTVQAMQEVGIDISQQTSKALSQFQPEEYDAVISLCGCGVNLPEPWILREVFADWQLEDPEGQSVETYRRIRDQVKERVMELIQSLKG